MPKGVDIESILSLIKINFSFVKIYCFLIEPEIKILVTK
jgi:hypothetical protein